MLNAQLTHGSVARRPTSPCVTNLSWQLSIRRPLGGNRRCGLQLACAAITRPQHAAGGPGTSKESSLIQDVQVDEGHAQVPAAHDVRIIGLGARGVSAMKRLSGSNCIQGINLWAIDSDKKVLSSTAGLPVQVVELQPSDDSTLSPADLLRISGDTQPLAQGSVTQHHGVAFVLGSAFGSPGGSTLMLQVVNHLRRCGYFVAVALTRPFAFEGARKLEQADALIEAMEDVAAMVVVIDQNVLTRASSELTMHEASAIADNTLEYTVRSLMSALHAPEVLKVTRGAFQWYGRDLRLMKHPLFPPMMHLVTCPGVGNLGRGRASMPMASLHQARLPSALSTLAEDAVKAAAESPFLENKVSSSTAMLCVLLLPRCIMDLGMMGKYIPSLTDHQREYALRSAIQVAAMTVQELAGPQCTDIIVCPQVRDDEDARFPSASQGADGDAETLTLECAMLALQAIDEAATPTGSTQLQQPASAPTESTDGTSSISPLTRLGLGGRERPAQQVQPQARPSTGTPAVAAAPARVMANSANTASQPAAAPSTSSGNVRQPISGAPVRANSSGPMAGAAGAQGAPRARSKTNWSAMSLIAGGSAGASSDMAARARRTGAEEQARSDAQAQARLQRMRQGNAQVPATRPGAALSGSVPSSTNGTATPAARTAARPEPIPRMPDNLVTSLVAQSLDLPPGAARWRHMQRAAAAMPRSGTYQLPETSVALSDSEEGQEVVQRPLDVRARVVGMLEKERDF